MNKLALAIVAMALMGCGDDVYKPDSNDDLRIYVAHVDSKETQNQLIAVAAEQSIQYQNYCTSCDPSILVVHETPSRQGVTWSFADEPNGCSHLYLGSNYTLDQVEEALSAWKQ